MGVFFVFRTGQTLGAKVSIVAHMETTVKRFKRGDVREDGKVFAGYHPNCDRGEYWVPPDHFIRISQLAADRLASLTDAFQAHPRVRRCGDVDPTTGQVFWSYGKGCRGFEYWVTPEKFKQLADESAQCRLRVPAAVRKTYGQKKSAQFRKNNPGYGSQSTQKYYRRNPDKLFHSRIRLRLKKVTRWASVSGLQTSRAECKDTALWLLWLAKKIGVNPASPKGFHIDHLRPARCFDLTTQEGQRAFNAPENTWWLTAADNLSKKDRDPTPDEVELHGLYLTEYRTASTPQ